MRDLEETAWEVFQSIGTDPAETVDRKLKALELLVKIRLGGDRVKPKDQDAPASSRGMLGEVLERMNKEKGK
jgi:hypothetical protein